MPDSKKYLLPEAIQHIARLEVRARRVVEGFLSGMHRSPYFGQSVEFLQHREYTIGDDLRHVDWKVWARNDRLYVKQFEEDTNLRSMMVVDVSRSMKYGRSAWTKYDYAATLASSLACLILSQHDAVGCVSFDARIRQTVPVRSKRNQLLDVVQALEVQSPAEKTDLQQVLLKVAESQPRRGLMVVCSDFFAPLDTTVAGIRSLRQRGHEVICFQILDDDELDFPFDGPTRFEGLELNAHLTCNPRALRDGYLAALQKFLDELRRRVVALGVDYQLLRTSQSLGPALAAFLSRRMALTGHR
ncbi:MAG: DUF58 domain-containing protein [Pirellulales bacterium]